MIANRQLAEAGEVLITVYDGESTGTFEMIEQIRAVGLPVYVHRVEVTS